MANFRTHLNVGALVASAAAFASFGQGLSAPGETQGLFAVGLAAALLPDIDAEDSTPVRAVFGLAGILIGFLVAFAFADRLRLLDLVLVWAGVLVMVRYPVHWLFARFTVHRGIWHSLLMALVVALLVAIIADVLFGQGARMSWLAGGFTLIGYLTHLILDELVSVDLFDNRVKRSFGTALKPLSLRAWPVSLALLGLLAVLVGLSPDPAPLLAVAAKAGLDSDAVAAVWPRW